MTVLVKVCGIRTPGDARLAAELGAWAIGLVLWERSPRAVSLEGARAVAAAVPAAVRRVGVFVNTSPAAVADAVRAIGLDLVQLHGDEDVAAYRHVGVPLVRSVMLHSPSAVAAAAALPEDVVPLVDADAGAARGGTGRAANWPLAAALAQERRIWLAGGLTAGNVAAAVAAVGPHLVDVASGVESAPGVKDPAKMRAFFAAVKGARV